MVRTRPLDLERVLVTEAEAEVLEGQWEVFRERGGDLPLRPLLNEEELEAEAQSLRVRFEREPTPFDVASSLISHRSFDHLRRLELRSVRDFALAKASLLDQEGRTAEALAGYLGICFLDLNGVRNPPLASADGGHAASTGAVRGFAPEDAVLAPFVVNRCIQIIALLDQDEDRVRADFTAVAERQYQSLHPPRSVVAVWPVLAEAIFGAGQA